MEELIGKTIAGFKIEKKIGEGGMGAVYRAVQLRLKRDVALKILPGNLRDKNPAFAERFLREAQLAAQVAHPNIVQVYDVGEENGVYYMAMEFIRGRSVGDILREHGKIPEPEAVSITRQAAMALDAGCDVKLIHRDIKPENIMVTDKGVTKVADFGLAKNLDAATMLTQSGQIMGTPAYMSPEQGSGEDVVDHRSDLYSLGVTFYKMVTGEVPFTAGSPMGIIFKHLNAERPDPKALEPTLSDASSRIIRKMMAAKPDARYQTYRELIADLDTVEVSDAPTIFPMNLAAVAKRPGDSTDSNVPSSPTIQPKDGSDDTGHTLLEHTPVPASKTALDDAPTPPPGSLAAPAAAPAKKDDTITIRKSTLLVPLVVGAVVVLAGIAVVLALVFSGSGGGGKEGGGKNGEAKSGEGGSSGGTGGGGTGSGAGVDKPDPSKAPTGEAVPLEIVVGTPKDGAFVNAREAKVEGTVKGTGLEKILVNGREAKVEGGRFSAVVLLGSGRVPITVIATDKAGKRITRELDVTVDDDPPEISFGGGLPETGAVTRDEAFRLVIQLRDTFPDRVTVNGEDAARAGAAYRYDAKLPADGDHVFRIVGTDQAGNRAEKTVSVRRDTRPPSLSIAGLPESVDTAEPSVEVAVEADEDVALIEVNGREAGRGGRSFRVRVALAEGNNEIVVRGRDAAGNAAELKKTVAYRNPDASPEARERKAFEAIARAEGDPFQVAEALAAYVRSRPDSPYAGEARKLIAELKRKDLPAGVVRGERRGAFLNEKDGAEMVRVTEGTFPFGRGAGTSVACSAFFLYRTEVTNARFAKFVAAQGGALPKGADRPEGWIRKGAEWAPRPGSEDLPVAGVTWAAASAYAQWAGGDLPTEAQWEYAARGPGGGAYPWGAETPDSTLARYAAQGPLPAGSLVRGASSCGALDMAGNVWEWCRDQFADAPGFAAGSRDPVFTGFSFGRVIKGGGFNSKADSLLAVNRTGLAPGSAHAWLGFRVAVAGK